MSCSTLTLQPRPKRLQQAPHNGFLQFYVIRILGLSDARNELAARCVRVEDDLRAAVREGVTYHNLGDIYEL